MEDMFPAIPDEYCCGVAEAPSGAVTATTFPLELVDLRGRSSIIHFELGGTFGDLRGRLAGRAYFFVAGEERPFEDRVQDFVPPNGGVLRVLVDGRPRAPEAIEQLEEFHQHGSGVYRCVVNHQIAVHNFHSSLSTPAGRASTPPFKYAYIRRLKQCIYGGVYQVVKVFHQAGNEYFLPDGEGRQEVFAVKQMRKHEIHNFNPRKNRHQEDPMTEVAINLGLRRCGGHPHVMGMTDVGHDAEYVYLIMPFANGGELFDVLDTNGRQSEHDARFIVGGMLQGMQYCHDYGVSVNDTSLENTMLHVDRDENRVRPVLMDFGMSSLVQPVGMGGRAPNMPNLHGKKFYLAPEVFQRTRYDGIYADIWSMGVIILMLVSGVPVCDEASENCKRFRYVRDGRLSEVLNAWTRHGIPAFSQELHDLVNRMLRVTPVEDRLAISLVLEHPWVVGDLGDPARLTLYRDMMSSYDDVRHMVKTMSMEVLALSAEYNAAIQTLVQSINNYRGVGGQVNALVLLCRRQLPGFPPDV